MAHYAMFTDKLGDVADRASATTDRTCCFGFSQRYDGTLRNVYR